MSTVSTVSTVGNLMGLAQAWVAAELKEPGSNAAFIACADLRQALTAALEPKTFLRERAQLEQEWVGLNQMRETYRRPPAAPTLPSTEDLHRWRTGYERYEKARKLNPAQWAELHRRNLAGEWFDDMIDALDAAAQPKEPS